MNLHNQEFEFVQKKKIYILFRLCNEFKLVMQIHDVDKQKATWFQSDYCVSCASN